MRVNAGHRGLKELTALTAMLDVTQRGQRSSKITYFCVTYLFKARKSIFSLNIFKEYKS